MLLWGGIRLRSRFSPEGGPNQKWCFRSDNGIFSINSCILGGFYMKSYKKLNQKAQNLEITTFTMGIRPKIVVIWKKSVFFLKAQFVYDFYNKVQIQGRQGERGDQDVSEYVWHIGVGSYFPKDMGCQSWVT